MRILPDPRWGFQRRLSFAPPRASIRRPSAARSDHARLPDRAVRAPGEPLLAPGTEQRQSAQIEVLGGQLLRRASRRSPYFGGLQGRFDNAGNTQRDLILQLEHFL